jgi:hypothetical protein
MVSFEVKPGLQLKASTLVEGSATKGPVGPYTRVKPIRAHLLDLDQVSLGYLGYSSEWCLKFYRDHRVYCLASQYPQHLWYFYVTEIRTELRKDTPVFGQSLLVDSLRSLERHCDLMNPEGSSEQSELGPGTDRHHRCYPLSTLNDGVTVRASGKAERKPFLSWHR